MKGLRHRLDNNDGPRFVRRSYRVNDYERALQILRTVRKRLADRFVEDVLRNEPALLDPNNRSVVPFACDAELERAAASFAQLDAYIEGLAKLLRAAGPAVAALPPTEDHTYDRFVDLAKEGRLNEAAHVLAAIMPMPMDRVLTATRFFARHQLKEEAAVRTRLAQIRPAIAGKEFSKALQVLMQVFGFQAVEAQIAIRALLARQ